MSLCNSNKDGCSLEAALDEVDELTSKTQAGIERTLKKVESEGCNTEKYQMEEERIKNMYKLRVLLHHGNKVNFKLPGTSIKEAASEASAKKIQYREEEEAASEVFQTYAGLAPRHSFPHNGWHALPTEEKDIDTKDGGIRLTHCTYEI